MYCSCNAKHKMIHKYIYEHIFSLIKKQIRSLKVAPFQNFSLPTYFLSCHVPLFGKKILTNYPTHLFCSQLTSQASHARSGRRTKNAGSSSSSIQNNSRHLSLEDLGPVYTMSESVWYLTVNSGCSFIGPNPLYSILSSVNCLKSPLGSLLVGWFGL